MARFDSKTAKQAGQKGGRAKGRTRVRRLERLGVWSAAGFLSGSVAGAAVRSVEVWLKAHESRLTERVVDELTSDVKRLKGELRVREAV